MNRLIIIGNGFDLAHGLKTRYSDFMLDYLKETLSKANAAGLSKSFFYEDELIKVFGINRIHPISKENLALINDQKTLADFFSLLEENNFEYQPLYSFTDKLIKNNRDFHWVDIENIFHKELLQILKHYHSYASEETRINLLKDLNLQMEFLRAKLVKYLVKIENKFKWGSITKDSKEFLKVFSFGAAKKSVRYPLYTEAIDTRVLNFNYTNIANHYCKELESEYSIREIPLHGQLVDPESIVFGFGDEVHSSYQEIEDLDENLFFEHIKSFKYLQNEYYQDLMAFLESGQFEVFVLGHSLGLSDRTMLQAIFNSNYLEKVQLFYYEKDGKNNFVEMTHQLSRHFTDKNRMRTKVVPFSKSEPLPQFPTSQENL
ncbi:MAG: AbiH family protein [Fluviicola sp.]|nr:AbiH family protein [Fluviicola sp.]